MTTKPKAERFDAKYLNRKGPGGYDLDPTEAMAWFPDLYVPPMRLATEHEAAMLGIAPG